LPAQDARVRWARRSVRPGDERAVAPDSPDSNARLLRETLVVPGALDGTRLHAPFAAMPSGPAEVEAAALAFERALPARFDLVLLGLGADGHVASLFPGSSALAERTRGWVAVEAPAQISTRLTLTPPRLLSAGALLVLASGEAKAAAVARALEGPPDLAGCPGQLARHGTWLLDVAAASRLQRVQRPRAGEPPRSVS